MALLALAFLGAAHAFVARVSPATLPKTTGLKAYTGDLTNAPFAIRDGVNETVFSAPMPALVGATAPMGTFDPLGFMDGASPEKIMRLRECELKHGRVAMAAILGMWTEPVLHPLAKSCHVTAVSDPFKAGIDLCPAGKLQILGFCAGVEFLAFGVSQGYKYRPGDILGAAYRLDDEAEPGWVQYQEKELNNGRLAMMAFMGFVAQYALYGTYEDMLFKPLLK